MRRSPGLASSAASSARRCAPKVLDVDVVADGGDVRGRVVRAEDLYGNPLAQGGLEDERDQVRLRLVVLAQPAAGPRDVEVPEARRRDTVGVGEKPDQPVHRGLGAAVGAGRTGRAVSGIGGSSGSP